MAVAQQPVGARHIAGGEHEAVAALRHGVQHLAQHVTQAGKTFECT
jgi:hypothetical protein